MKTFSNSPFLNLKIVLHSDATLQIAASPLYDFVSVTVLSRRDLQQRVESFSNANCVVAQLSPVFLSQENDRNKGTFHYPDESKSSSFEYLQGSGRQLPLTELYGISGDTLLIHGSLISMPADNNCMSFYQLEFQHSDHILDNNKRRFNTLSSGSRNDIDFTQYALRASDISKVVFDKGSKEVHIPFQHAMLNTLPCSSLPTKEYASLQHALEEKLRNQELDSSMDGIYCNSIVCGEKGTGKTYFITSLAARIRMRLSYSTIFLDCGRLQATKTKMEDVLNELTRMFTKAIQLQPSLILLDSLDLLIPNSGSFSGMNGDNSNHHQNTNPMLITQSKLLSDHLEFLMSGIRGRKVAIFCTCLDENKLHKSLRTVKTFSSKISVPVLQEADRHQIFLYNLSQNGSYAPRKELISIDFLNRTKSFLPQDLKIISSKVALGYQKNSFSPQHTNFTKIDVELLLSRYTPLTQQALHLKHSKAKINFSNIGGLFTAKSSLSLVILKPMKYNFVYKHSPISLPKGLLLYGFPGCGKSCIVPAIAQECGFNLVTCHGPELLDKFIGASEGKVRKLFERAYAAAPAILFLDEFDALAPRRGSDNTGVTDRVVNQLLTFLDGVEDQRSCNDSMVYIIAATSRPDKIDPALVRPGRLEKHIFVGYPENDSEFDDLLCKISNTRSVDEKLKCSISNGSFREELNLRKCQYLTLSPSDIQGAFDTAHLSSVHDILRNENKSTSRDAKVSVLIQSDHLLEAFERTRPSLSTSDHQMFSKAFAPFLGTTAKGAPLSKRKLKTTLK